LSALLAEIAAEAASWQFAAAAAATAVAGLMRGYAGFGTAVLLAPIFATLWGPRAGVPVMLLMELIVSAQLLPQARLDADRRLILPLGAAACVATPLGAWVLLVADGGLLRRAIGALVLAFGGLLMSGWRYHGTRPLPLNLAIGGVAGLLKGATGMSGPPVILYLLAGPEAARRHRANLILFFALIGVISLIAPAIAGLFDTTAFARTLLLLPILMGCVPIGARLFRIVPERWYRPFAYAVLIGAGSIALLA
jgi:hypothetical protein